MLRASAAGRLFLIGLAVTILVIVYLFQRVDLIALFRDADDVVNPNLVFVINRYIRLIFNDLACIIIIYSLFGERKYMVLAFWIFLFELVVLLPLYLVIKLDLEGPSEISSPLLSQIHRLIVNPTLMLLLIAGFLYQKYAHLK